MGLMSAYSLSASFYADFHLLKKQVRCPTDRILASTMVLQFFGDCSTARMFSLLFACCFIRIVEQTDFSCSEKMC